jgi:hypothetical protein
VEAVEAVLFDVDDTSVDHDVEISSWGDLVDLVVGRQPRR